VVFKEVGRMSESKVVQTENNPKKVRFELRKKEEDDSDEEVEQMTPVVRRYELLRKPVKRYSPPNFFSAFMLTSTNEDPNSVREEVDSIEGRL
jgi:hypothetical protein